MEGNTRYIEDFRHDSCIYYLMRIIDGLRWDIRLKVWTKWENVIFVTRPQHLWSGLTPWPSRPHIFHIPYSLGCDPQLLNNGGKGNDVVLMGSHNNKVYGFGPCTRLLVVLFLQYYTFSVRDQSLEEPRLVVNSEYHKFKHQWLEVNSWS